MSTYVCARIKFETKHVKSTWQCCWMCTHWNKPKMAHHTFIIYTYVFDLLIAQEIDSLLSHNENSTKWKLKERFSPIQPLDSRCTQRDATQSSSPSSSLTFCPSSFCVCVLTEFQLSHIWEAFCRAIVECWICCHFQLLFSFLQHMSSSLTTSWVKSKRLVDLDKWMSECGRGCKKEREREREHGKNEQNLCTFN